MVLARAASQERKRERGGTESRKEGENGEKSKHTKVEDWEI